MALARNLTRSLTYTRPLLSRPTPYAACILVRTFTTPSQPFRATESTALLKPVKAREEAEGVEVVLGKGEGQGIDGSRVGIRKVVMEGGKGSEGRHSKGE